MSEFAASIERTKAKSVLALGGFAPLTPPPDQGLCLWTSLGAPPPDPALAMAPLCQILNTTLGIRSCLLHYLHRRRDFG